MEKLKIPAFGESKCIENRENENADVFVISNVDEDSFIAYSSLFEEHGYVKKEEYRIEKHRFAAFSKRKKGVFLNYFDEVRELYIVIEDNCAYFSYNDLSRGVSVSPQITQIETLGSAMSYAIRLSDGRFIIIDGAEFYKEHSERLFKCLSKGSPYEKPVIAAWIMSHPHSDHYLCFIDFMERFADEVVIEKFLLNFPDATDAAHYPQLGDPPKNLVWGDTSAHTNIPKMYAQIEKLGVPVYMAHTGQKYRIGDADCEILACMDDTIHRSNKLNATSIVIRMSLGGQVILWSTDAAFSVIKLAEKYGSYLKADILQIPHHGFPSGSSQGQINAYELIKPSVCFLPTEDYFAYVSFCSHHRGSRYLMTNADVNEIITLSPQRTITLPYTAPAYKKEELRRKYLSGRESSGASTWIFTDLSTACPEDFEFTLLNTTHVNASVDIELYFESKDQMVKHIKVDLISARFRRISIIGDEVDGDAVPYSKWSLKARGIPENAPFAVRFMSSVPIVVSHKNHTATYRSSVIN